MADAYLGTINVESVERVTLTLTAGGAAPTGAVSAVTFTFRKPDGTTFGRAATNDTGDDWYVDLEDDDFTAADLAGSSLPVVRVGVRAVIDGLVRKVPHKIWFRLADNP